MPMTHLVPNAYGPRIFGPHNWSQNWLVPLDKQTPTNSVPMDKWSPKIQSPWTNGPQPIRSLYFRIPIACLPGQTEYSRDHLSRGTKLVEDHLSMGTELVGDRLSWRTNQLETDCWVQNVREPYAFETKCISYWKIKGQRRNMPHFKGFASMNLLFLFL